MSAPNAAHDARLTARYGVRAYDRSAHQSAYLGRRWRVDDLIRAAGLDNRLQLDRALGRSRGWANTVNRRGGLTVDQADDAATRLGLHPLDVWGDAWLDQGRPGPGGPVCPSCYWAFATDDELDDHECRSDAS